MINIAKLDCTEYRSICKDYEIKGYPTLLWFENGKKIDKYSGPRSLDDLKAYIEQQLPTVSEAKPSNLQLKVEGEGIAVLHLTTESFTQVIGKGITFIKFCKPLIS